MLKKVLNTFRKKPDPSVLYPTNVGKYLLRRTTTMLLILLVILILAILIPLTTVLASQLGQGLKNIGLEIDQLQDLAHAPQGEDLGNVLAEADEIATASPRVSFNIPANFKDDVYIEGTLLVQGKGIFPSGIEAPNVVYSVTAGPGIRITGNSQEVVIEGDGVTSLQGQTGALVLQGGSGITIEGTTISSDGVTSIGGQTGDISLVAGDGISISGTTISASNADAGSAQSIFKNIAVSSQSTIQASSNTDTLTFAAGSGISLTTNTSTKTVTITGSTSTPAGWTDNGSTVTLTTVTDSVGIGTSSPTTKLHVVGNTTLDGDVTTTGAFNFSNLAGSGNRVTYISNTGQLNAITDGSNGQVLSTDGSGNYSFITVGGTGTITAVGDITAGAAFNGTGGNTLQFEGSTADGNEISLTGADATADRTITLPDLTGTIALLEGAQTFTGAKTFSGGLTSSGAFTASSTITLTGEILGATPLIFEGATANTSELTLAVADVTSDRTITFPDADGTVTLQNGTFTSGSVVFANSSGQLDQDNANIFYDNTTDRLGVGTNSPGVRLDVNGDVLTRAQGDVRFADSDSSNYFAIQAPGALTADYTLTLPADDGTSGQTLQTDGNGVLSWTSAGSGTITAVGDVTSGGAFSGTSGNTLQFEGATANAFEISLTGADATSDQTITLPDLTGTIALLEGVQTFTGAKTFSANTTFSSTITTADDQWIGLGSTAGRIEWDDQSTDEVNILDANLGLGTSTPATRLDVNGDARLMAQGDMRFADADSSNYIAFQAPAALTADYTLTLPADDGTSGQVLTTDGSGVLTWSTGATGDITDVGDVTSGAAFNGTQGNTLQFEGSTADGNEISLSGADATADRTITLPDLTGTIALLENAQTFTGAKTFSANTTFSSTITTADDQWIGLGSTAGRIEWDDQATDEVNILSARLGIGTSTPGVALDINGDSRLLAQGDMRFADADSSNYIAFQAPAALTADYTLTLPADDGTSGQVLQTDGSGVLSWVTGATGTITSVGDVTSGAAFSGTAGNTLQFEGSTADAFEISLTGADATSDRTITLPDLTGTLALLENAQTFTGAKTFSANTTFSSTITTADDQWIGLGSTAGRIEWDDQSTDEVNILDANLGLGTATPATRLDINGDARLQAQGDMRFADADSSNYIAFQAPAALTADYTLTLPPDDGTSNYVLTTDGNGVLTWQSVTGIGAGDITDVGDVTSGAAFNGTQGNTLQFEGSTADGNEISLTAADATSDRTITIPDLTGTLALLENAQTFTGAKTFSANTTFSSTITTTDDQWIGLGSTAGRIEWDDQATDEVNILSARLGVGTSTPAVALDVNGDSRLMAQGDMRFADADSSNYIAFQAPSALTADYTLTLPADDGTSGQVLTTDGSGVLTWVSGATGTITAVGDVTSGGAFDGTAGNTLQFEGATANAFEVSLTAVDVTADYTITLPELTGTVALLEGTQTFTGAKTFSGGLTSSGAFTASSTITLTGEILGANPFILEGATANTSELTISVADVTSDRTVTFADLTGTVALLENAQTFTGAKTFSANTTFSSTITTADDQWIGLGSTAGRIEWDDQSTDEVNILNARLGIGTSTPGVELDVNGDARLQAQGDLRFADSDSSNYIALQAPGALTADYTLTLPADDGTSGQILSTDGSGVLSWVTAGAADITAVGDVTSGDAFTGTQGNTLQFEGSTADGNEISLTGADATADRTITLPDLTGTVALLEGTQTFTGAKTFSGGLTASGAFTASSTITLTGEIQGANPFILEGATADGNELTIAVADVTSDRTITIPDLTGTLALLENAQTFTGAKTFSANTTFSSTITTTDDQWIGLGSTAGRIEWDDQSTDEVNILNARLGIGTSTPAVELDINGDSRLMAQGDMRFADADSSNYIAFQAPSALTADYTLTLPPDDGTSNYVLTTDGNGVLTWQSVTGIGAGDITDVGDVTSGAAFNGTQGNTLQFEGSTADGNEVSLTAADATADRTITLPDLAGTVALLEGTQTFTGAKTFSGGLTSSGAFTASSTITLTGEILGANPFILEGASADGNELTISVADITSDRTVTFADLTGTVALLENAQTFTGAKTFSANTTFTSTITTADNQWIGLGSTAGQIEWDDQGTDEVNILNAFLGVGTSAPAVRLDVNGDARIMAQGDLRFADSDSSNYFAIQAPTTLTADYTLTLPADDGTSGQVLTTDGSGVLTWTSGNTGDITDVGDVTGGAAFNGTQGNTLQFEGSTADANEISLTGADATADRTITLPDLTGTIALLENAQTFTGAKTFSANTTFSSTITTADDQWIGLGSTAGRIEWDDQSTDEVNILNARLGIGTTAPAVALDVNGDSRLMAQGDMRFADADSSNYMAIQAPSALTADYTLTLPADDGTSGQVLQTDGSGVLSWVTDGGGDITDVGDVTSGAAFNGTQGNTLQFEGATANAFEISLTAIDATADYTITLPEITGTLALLEGTQTFTGAKTFSANTTFTSTITTADNQWIGLGSTAGQIEWDDQSTDEVNILNAFLGVGTSAPAVRLDVNGDARVMAQGDVRFADSDSSNYMAIQSPTSLTADYTLTLPADDGTSGQVLSTDGSGVLSWVSAGAADITAVGDVTSGDAFTGTQGNTLQFEGSTADGNEISLTGADATADRTITLPDLTGTIALLENAQTFTGAKIFSANTTFSSTITTADDQWIGLGSTAGRIEWDDQSTDEVNILNARLGIGTTAPAVALDVNGDSRLMAQGDMRFADADSSNYMAIQAPTTLTADYTLTLPADDGDNNYVLTTDGNGVLTWQSVGGVGAGDITDVGDVTSGAAFNGTQGNTLQFEGSTADGNEISLTGADATSDRTITLPDLTGTLALLENAQTFTGAKTFSANTTFSSTITTADNQWIGLGSTAGQIEWDDQATDEVNILNARLGVGTSAPAVALDVNGDSRLMAQGDMRFADADSSNYMAIQAPSALTADYTLTLPADDGDTNYVLTTDGNGVLTWQSVGGVGAGDITDVGDVTSGAAFNGTQGNTLQFEGATANAFEISLTAADATADYTITLPEITGTVALLEGTQTFTGAKTFSGGLTSSGAFTASSTITLTGEILGANPFILEGSTADGNELTISVADVTSDRTVTFADLTGTVALLENAQTFTGAKTFSANTTFTSTITTADNQWIGLGSTAGQIEWDDQSTDEVNILNAFLGVGTSAPAVRLDVNGDARLMAQGDLRFADSDSSNYFAIQAPTSLTADYTLTLPADDGTSGQVLTTDGSGVLTWTTGNTGDITDVGDVTSGAAFNGTQGNTLQFEGSTADGNEISLTGSDATADRTITLPDLTGTIALLEGTQTFTGAKTFSGGLTSSGAFTASSTITLTGEIQGATPLIFEGSSADANELTIAVADVTADRTVTFADLTGTVALLENAQTFTGAKTFSANTTFSSTITTADNQWIGLGSTAGQIEFDDQTTDEINILNAFLGVGTSAPAVRLDVNGDARIMAQGDLRFADSDSSNYFAIQAPTTLTADYTLTLPADDGTSGQVLTTDGSGVLSWISAATGDITAVGDVTSGDAFNGTQGNTLQFEGGTADGNEISLTGADATADQTITLPDLTGTIALLEGTQTFTGAKTFSGGLTSSGAFTASSTITLTGEIQGASPFILEGGTADANELTISVADVTADRTVTFADLTGTVALLENAQTFTGAKTFSANTTFTSTITTADNQWIGLGSTAGQIEFDDQSTDEINVLNAFLGVGTSAPAVRLDVNGDARVMAQGDVRFADSDSSNYFAIQAPTTLTADYTLTLPADDGTSGQVLSTDGSGVLSWVTGNSGDITDVGDVTSGAAFNGTQGNVLQFEGATANASEISLTAADATADYTITLPELTGTVALLEGTQTFTGAKTFSGGLTSSGAFTASSTITLTGEILGANPFILEGASADGNELTISVADVTSDRTVTFADLTGTVALLENAQTFTGAKTFSANTTFTSTITTADNQWIGLGSTAGQIEWDDQTTDEVNILNAFLGVGTSAPAVRLDVNGDARVMAQGDVRFADSDSSNYMAIQAPTTLTADYTLTLPADDGTSGQVLSTDGSGVLSWLSAATGDITAVGDVTSGDAFNGTQGNTLQFEGSTADGNEISLSGADATADRTITLPDLTGTIALLENAQTFTGAKTFSANTTFSSTITTADNQWIGLGSTAGQIEWDDQATDEVNILNARLGVGTSTPAVTLDVNGDGRLMAQGDMRFADADSSNYMAIQAPSALTADYTLTLPADDGTSGQVLTTDGSGVLSWATDGGGDITDVGDVTSGAAFNGTQGNTLQFEGATANAFEISLTAIDATADYTITLPEITGTLALLEGTQTFTGAKTFSGGLTSSGAFTASSTITLTGEIQGASPFILEGASADNNELTIAVADVTADRTVTFADLTGTVALLENAQTFTGAKTFSANTTFSSTITTADNQWIGLGSTAGQIEFDDQTTDEINILNAFLGVGTSTPAVRLDVNGDARVMAQGDVRFADSDSSNYFAIQAPTTLTADYTLTLPTDDGTSGQVLSTDGSGVLSWVTGNSGDITDVGDVTSGAAFNGTQGNTLQFEGATANASEISLTAADATADYTITLPELTGTVALLEGTQTFTGAKTFSANTTFTSTITTADNQWIGLGSTAGQIEWDDQATDEVNILNAFLGVGTSTPAVRLDVNGDARLMAQGDLRFADSDSSNYMAIQSPTSLTADYTLTLPADDGTSGQILQTDGSGVLSWVTDGGGDITAVGSMTSGAVFADSTADDDWLGLGSTAGRIEFDDQTIDEINLLSANIGIGTTAPAGKVEIVGSADDQQLIVRANGTQTANLMEWQNSSGTALSSVNGSGFFGIGAAPSASFGLNLAMSPTDTSGTIIGGRFISSASPSTNSSASFRGAFIQQESNTASNITGVLMGLSVNSTKTGAGTDTEHNGFDSTINVNGGTVSTARNLYNIVAGGGNITTGRAIESRIRNTGSGTIGTASNFYIRTPENSGGGAITTQYGLYMEDLNVAGTSYSILTNAGDIVFNEGGDSATDVRIEGDTDTGLFYAQGSTDRVGIGTTAPGVKLDVNGDLQLRAQGDARFADSDSSNYMAIQAPTTLTSNYTLTLPVDDGTSGQVLSTDGSGVLSWSTAAAGDITAVGSITSGDAFSDSTADDDWLGLGSTAGRIEFDDQATDEVNILTARLGVGTSTPAALTDFLATTEQMRLSYDGSNSTSFTVTSGGDLTLTPTGGNIGLNGAAFSGATLDIGGSAATSSNIAINSALGTNQQAMLYFNDADAGGAGDLGWAIGRLTYSSNPGGNLVFYEDDANVRMTIENGGGFVGIGVTDPTVILDVNGDARVMAQGDVRFADSDSSNYMAIQAPTTLTSNYTLTLPADDGTSGQVLSTDGSGVLSWSTAAAGDITAVGSITSGDAFSDSTADDDWLGLGSTAGRIEFDDQATDEVNILAARLGVGTTAPAALTDFLATTEQMRLSYDASNYSSFTVSSGGDLTIAPSGSDTNVTGNLAVSGYGAYGGSTNASYLLNMTSGTSTDFDRVINIAHSNDAAEDSTVFQIANTVNPGTISGGGRTIYNANFSLTPTFVTTRTANVYGTSNSISLSDADIGDTPIGDARINVYGNQSLILGTPDINDTDGTNTGIISASGMYSSVSIAPTYTSLAGGASVSTYAGQFLNSSTSPGDGAVTASSYGLSISSTGNLTTSGTTTHTGAEISVTGTADTNYGLRVSAVQDATANYGLAINGVAAAAGNYAIYANAAAQNYLEGDLGLGTSSPTVQLDVNGDARLMAQGDLRFADSDSTNYMAIQAPTTLTTDYTLTLPADDGTSGQVLQTDGSGVLSWATAGSGDITDVGSMTSGAAFAGTAADNQWLGLGSTAGRIYFDDLSTDTISFLSANVGIGTSAPVAKLDAVVPASTTLTNFTQALTSAAMNIVGTYDAGGNYIGGISWSTSDNNATRPKAGIFAYADGDGSDLIFSASGAYATGIAGNNMVLDEGGRLGLGSGPGGGAFPARLYVVPTANTAIGAIIRGQASQTGNLLELQGDGGTFLSAFDENGYLGIGTSAPTNQLEVVGNAQLNAQGDVRFADSDSSNYAAIQSPTTITTNYTLTLPVDDGTSGQVLSTDGSGILSWATVGAGDITDVGDVTSGAAFNGTQGNTLQFEGATANAFEISLTAADATADYTITLPEITGTLALLEGTQTFTGAKTFSANTTFSSTITTADNQWIGLGSTAGQIEWDDQATDEVNILNANLGLGTSTPATRLDVNGDARLMAQGDLRFADSDSSNYMAIQAPTTLTTDYTLTLPGDDGTSGQVLQTNGTGTLSWADAGDITAVGSMTTGAAFADSTADDDWLGLGSTAGRIEFDDQTTDEVNFLSSNVGIGTSTPTSVLHVASTASTGVGVDYDINSLSTGTGFDVSSSSTSLTTGNIMNVSWTGAATATGDLMRLTLGSSSNIGNLLNLVDGSTSIFSVSETAFTTSLPTNFTAAGDLSVAYDLLFTNNTAAAIKANGPLTISSGESFENLDLTLTTYGTGKTIVNGVAGAEVNANIASGYALEVFNDGNATNRLGLLVQAGTDSASTGTLVQFLDGDGTDVGEITYSGTTTTYSTSSDIRMKDNIVDTGKGLADVLNIEVKDFTFITEESGRVYTGFIAQQLYDIFPDAVSVQEGEGKYWGVDYGKITPLLVRGIQEQQLMIDNISAVSEDYTNNFTDYSSDTDTRLATLQQDVATMSAALAELETATNIGDVASIAARLDTIEQRTTTVEEEVASLSAKLADLVLNGSSESAGLATSSADLEELTVTGNTNLFDLGVTGTISAGMLTIEGLDENSEAAINTLSGPLKLQSLGLNSVELMGGKVIVDTDGNIMTTGEITATKVNINTEEVLAASAGKGTILTGDTEAVIETTAVTANSLIFVTATTQTGEQLAVTSQINGTSFTVSIENAQLEDITFNWWIVDEVN